MSFPGGIETADGHFYLHACRREVNQNPVTMPGLRPGKFDSQFCFHRAWTAQLSVASGLPRCKRRKAGRGLGRGYEGTTSGTTILAHWTETETLEAYERYVVWIVVMWIKKTQKSWKHSYLHTLHTPAIAWTFNLQHIVYTTRCMSLNCRNHCRKCHNILCDGMLLLARPIIVKSCYYCIKISPCVCVTHQYPGVYASLNIDT